MANQKLTTRKCKWCDDTFTQKQYSQKYCSIACQKESNKFDQLKRQKEQYAALKHEKAEAKVRNRIMTDEEQAEINRKLNEKFYDNRTEVKSIRPGDPEFDAVAKSITPLDKICNVAYKESFCELGVLI